MGYATPYTGLKVIDLSQGVAGPYCAMLLAQYGANVIKVEPTDTGDWARGLGTIYGDHTAYSIPANLGKRSIALDLEGEAGKAALWRLIAGADVFIQGFRPGVIDRLGFRYDAVAAREPRILYLSVSGFGLRGPLAERPAMDPVLQAYTGLMAENVGHDGVPHRVPIIAIDMSTAIYGFTAVSAALLARQSEPRGRHLEASLIQSAASLQVVNIMATISTARPGPSRRPRVCIRRRMAGFRSPSSARSNGMPTAPRWSWVISRPKRSTARPTTAWPIPNGWTPFCARCCVPAPPRTGRNASARIG